MRCGGLSNGTLVVQGQTYGPLGDPNGVDQAQVGFAGFVIMPSYTGENTAMVTAPFDWMRAANPVNYCSGGSAFIDRCSI